MKSSLLVAVLALSACAKSSAPPAATTLAPAPPPAAEPAAPAGPLTDAQVATLMEDLDALFGKVADAVESAGTDCDAMATRINKVADAHLALRERLRALNDPDTEHRSIMWLQDHSYERSSGNARRLYLGAEPCAEHPGVQAAMDRVTTKPPPAGP